MKNWWQLKQERTNSAFAYFRFRVADKLAKSNERITERLVCPSADWAWDGRHD